jgi:hypothetical protein
VSGKGRARIFLFAPFRKSVYFCKVVFLYVQKVACLVAISSGDLRSFQIWFFGVYFARSAVCGSGFFIAAIPPKSVELKPQLQFVFYCRKKYVSKGIAN